jgi:hypothetical protein
MFFDVIYYDLVWVPHDRPSALRRAAHAHAGVLSQSLVGAQRFGVGHLMPDTKSLVISRHGMTGPSLGQWPSMRNPNCIITRR